MTQTPYAPPETSQLSSEEKLCSTCNAVIHRKAEICPKCGVRQRRPANKAVLLLLTFFLGGFGIHRFYLGNYFLGTLYFLFFWTGIPSLIAIVEFIVFLFISSETIEENYTAHGSAMVFVVVFIVIIPFIGIIAAVAIPAYNDYLIKAKVKEAMVLLLSAKTEVNNYVQDTGKIPSTEDLVGLKTSGKYVASIELNPQEYYIQATMKEGQGAIGGKTLRLTYVVDQNTWVCSADYPNGIDEKYLPRRCRR
jgi:TM2 domain-containing membrane protein YozV/Tfp pilus assembly major pilin PilA